MLQHIEDDKGKLVCHVFTNFRKPNLVVGKIIFLTIAEASLNSRVDNIRSMSFSFTETANSFYACFSARQKR